MVSNQINPQPQPRQRRIAFPQKTPEGGFDIYFHMVTLDAHFNPKVKSAIL